MIANEQHEVMCGDESEDALVTQRDHSKLIATVCF